MKRFLIYSIMLFALLIAITVSDWHIGYWEGLIRGGAIGLFLLLIPIWVRSNNL